MPNADGDCISFGGEMKRTTFGIHTFLKHFEKGWNGPNSFDIIKTFKSNRTRLS